MPLCSWTQQLLGVELLTKTDIRSGNHESGRCAKECQFQHCLAFSVSSDHWGQPTSVSNTSPCGTVTLSCKALWQKQSPSVTCTCKVVCWSDMNHWLKSTESCNKHGIAMENVITRCVKIGRIQSKVGQSQRLKRFNSREQIRP